MKHCLLSILMILIVLFASEEARSQSCGEDSDVLIVLDASYSMSDLAGSTSKWAQAKSAVTQLVKDYDGQIRLGLMIFPGGWGGCSTGTLRVPVTDTTLKPITTALSTAFPAGATPIGSSLDAARSYLQGIDPDKTKYVLLVTDGKESCKADPVASVDKLLSAGIKTFVVGFGDGVDSSQLKAMASSGGAGPAYTASSLKQLSAVLQSIGQKVTCCGNGVLEAWEACDIAIAQGKAGACPSTCDDGDPCTADSPIGSGCKVVCSAKPMGQVDGDGCCPPGADATNDSDCTSVCGNGLLEQGELCDPKISAGPGVCKVEADCDDQDSCTTDAVAGSGCNVICENTPHEADPIEKDGCCPAGKALDDDADCPPPCGPDKTDHCVNLCQGVTCPDGQYCLQGRCEAWPEDPSTGDKAQAQGKQDAREDVFSGWGCSYLPGGSAGPGVLWLIVAGLMLLIAIRRTTGSGLSTDAR